MVSSPKPGTRRGGFAVVAVEVRALVERSTQAAQDIKSLVATTRERIEYGASLVDQSREAFSSIVLLASAVASQTDAISAVAGEQSSGLQEVDVALRQIDLATQQNAAMVEQSTAASRSLAAEAMRLTELVERFGLAGDRPGSRGAFAHERGLHLHLVGTNGQRGTGKADSSSKAGSPSPGTEEAEAIVREIGNAIGAHGMWKMRLRTAITTGRGDVSSLEASCDYRCAFGKWLYGSPMAALPKRTTHFQTVRKYHADFHRNAVKVLQCVENGQRDATETIMSGDYAACSEQLVEALAQWKADLSRPPARRFG